MRVLIATPCGGGQVTVQYLLSIMETYNQAQIYKSQMAQQIIAGTPGFNQADPQHVQGLQLTLNQTTIDIGLYTLAGESLLQRGRNHLAQVALTQAWDKLFFIDADAGWTFEQFMKVAMSPNPVTAGLCPLKIYPTSLNFLPFNEDEKYFDNAVRSFDGTKKMAAGHGSPLIKVPFVGTAFLCIDTSVLRKLSETTPHYIYPNPRSGEPESHWDFFNCGSVNETYLSEDWSFCHRAREVGFDVWIDTDVITTHTGNHTFRAG